MRSNHAERHSNTSTSHPPTQLFTHTPTSSNAHGRHSATNVRSGDVTGDGTHGTGYTDAHGETTGEGGVTLQLGRMGQRNVTTLIRPQRHSGEKTTRERPFVM
ncbi:hypothetical protein PISMIDRAFT_690663, partial [Pisolithus microcarpus 441]